MYDYNDIGINCSSEWVIVLHLQNSQTYSHTQHIHTHRHIGTLKQRSQWQALAFIVVYGKIIFHFESGCFCAQFICIVVAFSPTLTRAYARTHVTHSPSWMELLCMKEMWQSIGAALDVYMYLYGKHVEWKGYIIVTNCTGRCQNRGNKLTTTSIFPEEFRRRTTQTI